MRSGRIGVLSLLVLWAAVTGVTGARAAAPTEQLVMDLPATGLLAGVAQVAYQALARTYDVWWLREHEPQQRDRKVATIILNTNAPLQTTMGAALVDYVRQGGGLVFVLDSQRERLEDNRQQLAPLGVRVHLGDDQTRAVQVRDHAITAGVGNLGLVRAELTLSAGAGEVLVTQSARPIAVAGTLDQGRFVVLLDNVLSGAGAVSESSPAGRLLLQAVQWAAGGGGAVGPARPDEGTPTPPAPALAGTALVDLGGTKDRWPAIRAAVEAALDALGCKRETLTYTKETGTLAQALAADPALVVVGSARAFEEQEAAALGEYLWRGGALLAVSYATPTSIPDLQALNRLLAEAGLAVTFARPEGPAAAVAHPLTAGLQGWGVVPAGTSIWALGDEPLVNVAGGTVVATHIYGTGRVVVFDGVTLAPNPAAKTPAQDSSPVFRELLNRCLRWLVEKRGT